MRYGIRTWCVMAMGMMASVGAAQAQVVASSTANTAGYSPTPSASRYIGVSISGRVGTLGVGPEVGYHAPNTHWGVRGFYDTYNLHLDHLFTKRLNVEQSDVSAHVPVDFDGKFKLSNGGLVADVYPWARSGFRISGGVMYRGDHVTGTGTPQGDITRSITYYRRTYTYSQPAAEYGTLHARGVFNAVQPMLGIGYGGRLWGPLSMTVDAAAVYQGNPKTSVWGTGEVASVPSIQASIQRINREVHDDVHGFMFYPVVMVGFGYTF